MSNVKFGSILRSTEEWHHKPRLGQAKEMYCCAPAIYLICVWVGSQHSLFTILANAVYAQQIYSATAIEREVGETRNTEYRNNGITFN